MYDNFWIVFCLIFLKDKVYKLILVYERSWICFFLILSALFRNLLKVTQNQLYVDLNTSKLAETESMSFKSKFNVNVPLISWEKDMNCTSINLPRDQREQKV